MTQEKMFPAIQISMPEEYDESIPYPNANLEAENVLFRFDIGDERRMKRNDAMDEVFDIIKDNIVAVKKGDPFNHHLISVCVWDEENMPSISVRCFSRIVDEHAPQEMLDNFECGNRVYMVSIAVNMNALDFVLDESNYTQFHFL